jgi:glycosyltransferase involved in cell wall biosynthesis
MINDKQLAPIAIFTYNRLKHLRQTIESLQRNGFAKDSELFIFSDGPKKDSDKQIIVEIRQYLKTIVGFKKIQVFERESNFGLAKSIITGLSDLFSLYAEVIVLEDDLTVSIDFIEFMNSALNLYQNKEKVFSISAYCAPIQIPDYPFDTFFFQRINSWGWATWKDRWNSVDWELKDFNQFIASPIKRKAFNRGGKDLSMMLLKCKLNVISSWAIRFNYACFKQGKLNLYPLRSKVSNSGLDNSGTHTKKSTKFDVDVDHEHVEFNAPVEETKMISRIYMKFLSPSLIRQLINCFKIYRYILLNK